MPSLSEVVAKAKRELVDVSGLDLESVVLCKAEGDGWLLHVDMVEKRSIPATNDLIATFSVVVGAEGSIKSYERVRRYIRGNDGGPE